MTAPEPYYRDDFVTLWLGDARELTAWREGVGLNELVPGERILYARTWFRIERCVPDGAGWVTLRLDDGSSLETTTDALWTVKR